MWTGGKRRDAIFRKLANCEGSAKLVLKETTTVCDKERNVQMFGCVTHCVRYSRVAVAVAVAVHEL